MRAISKPNSKKDEQLTVKEQKKLVRLMNKACRPTLGIADKKKITVEEFATKRVKVSKERLYEALKPANESNLGNVARIAIRKYLSEN